MTPEADVVEGETTALVPPSPHAVAVRRDADLIPTMVSDVGAARARLAELQQFVREVMVEGDDYGKIPGVEKPVLLKPGAEKLCEIYGYAQQVTVVKRIEQWGRQTCATCGAPGEPAFFHYEVRCDLISKRTGFVVGSGVGSCNSLENKYRWREQQRVCPKCGKQAIIRGKEEYGGGWLCWKKRDGCGAKFKEDDAAITGQPAGKIENPEPQDLVNTILKMAKKRAVVDATLSVTRSSALFTQDMEDNGPTPTPEATATAATGPTDEQLADLDALIDTAGANRDDLLKFFKLKRLSEITATDYASAMKMLQAKIARARGKA